MATDRSLGRMPNVELAIRHFELGQSVDELAAALNVDQSTIRRRLIQARKEGLVRTLVVPPLEDGELASLQQDVRYKFDLEDVVLIPGRADILDMTEENAPKEAMVLSIAQAAARYLEQHLTNRDTLVVPWGRMANYIARQLRPPRPLPEVTVLPMVGVLALGLEGGDYLLCETSQLLPELGLGLAHGEADHHLLHAGILLLDLLQVGDGAFRIAGEPSLLLQHVPEVAAGRDVPGYTAGPISFICSSV